MRIWRSYQALPKLALRFSVIRDFWTPHVWQWEGRTGSAMIPRCFVLAARSSRWLFSGVNWKMVVAVRCMYTRPCFTARPCQIFSLRKHRFCPSGGGMTGAESAPSHGRLDFSRTYRLKQKEWKIHSGIDSATRFFLNNGPEITFCYKKKKIHFPLSSSVWSQQVGRSRETHIWVSVDAPFYPVSAHLRDCGAFLPVLKKKGNWLNRKCLNLTWLICFYVPLLPPIPSGFRFHSAQPEVHTLNQTANFEVQVSRFTFLHSGFTIISHTCSVSTCACNSSIYIKDLYKFFWVISCQSSFVPLDPEELQLIFQNFFLVCPKGLETVGQIKKLQWYFIYCKLRADNNVLQLRKCALEHFRFLCATVYLASPAASKTCASAAIILSLKVDLRFKNQ